MATQIIVDRDADRSAQRLVFHVLQRWFEGAPLKLGGATGRTMLRVFQLLRRHAGNRDIDLKQVRCWFLDEYFGHTIYAAYSQQHLGVFEEDGFNWDNIHVPRGCFYHDDGRLVTNADLSRILLEAKGEWEPRSEPGLDGEFPEVWIGGDRVTHPVLRQILISNREYDERVRTAGGGRLALLGLGRNCHVGFAEPGSPVGGVMLVRLSPSTQQDNAGDFFLTNGDGNGVHLEPAQFAITQGIETINTASELLLAAHGAGKQQAVCRMLTESASSQNPAGYAVTHPTARVFLDAASFTGLRADALRERGYDVHIFTDSTDDILLQTE